MTPDTRPAPTRTALLGSAWLGALAMLAPSAAQAVDGTWQGPGAEWTTGTNWSSAPVVPDGTATFTNGNPTSVTISSDASIDTIDFSTAATTYSFTVSNGATFTVNNAPAGTFLPNFSINTGATLEIGDGGLVDIASLAGGGTVTIGPSDPSTTLLIAGNSNTTFSGLITGAGSLELDDDVSLTLTGMGSTIGGDLDLCNCDTGGLTINGGSLVVGGDTLVEGGTLAVINGGTLQTTNLIVESTVLITGPGSTVTASGYTAIGPFGGESVTISNGGVLNSQGGAEIDAVLVFGGTPTVTVTGPGSTWTIGGLGLAVGGGSTDGPGILTISNGGTVNVNDVFIGDALDGSSLVTVTGAGSVLNATNSLTIGAPDCGCGPLVGTLTIADGGVVNSPGGTGIAAGSAFNLGTGGLAGAIITPAIVNDGRIVANFTDTLTLGADISGVGSLRKAGAGTLILSGNNTYAGGTTIDAGTLQLGNGGAGGSLAGDVVDNGLFAINRSDIYAFGGVISGTGAFAQIGTGTTILTAASTYTGVTTVGAGTLQAGATNTFAPLSAFTVASGATLNLAGFNQTIGSLAGAGNVMLGAGTLTTNGDNTSTTFAGVISGTGSLTKVGAGTLVLAGASTYSGGTLLAAGTLSLANDQALGTGALTTTGSVVDYSDGVTIANPIVVNSNTTQLQVTAGTATQAGAISELNGPRPLEKIGAGALVLSAVNTYTGPTTISAGTLVVNGSIANSAVTVAAGATLAGTGTVGATTILSGGMFSPGPIGTPGTMTVAGNLAFQSGALYVIQVNPSNASSDIVAIGGSATLAGTVQAAFASGRYASRTYTILSAAGGLNGTTFNSLTTSNLPGGFAASLSYTATDVILNLTAQLHAIPGSGLNINQRNVATALDNFFNNGGALPPNFVTVFGLTGGNLGYALSQLSGEAATGAQQAGFQLTSQFLGLMLDPFVDGRSGVAGTSGPALAFAPDRDEALPDDIALAYSKVLKAPKAAKAPTFEQRWSAWGGGFGGANRTSGDPAVLGSHDLSARTAGFAGGLDYRLTRDTVVGVALAGGGTNWSLADGLGGGKSDAFQAGLYGATRWGPAYLAAAFAYANHWMSTDRFAFAGDHLTASFNAQSFGGRIEGGYRYATVLGGVTPYAAIQAQSFRTPSYSETDVNNGGFALAYNSRTGTDTRSELGARFDHLLALNPAAALALRGRLAWAHDWVSDPSLAAAFQTLPGASFIVNGAVPAKDSALVSAGGELRIANGVTILGKFDGEFASRAQTYAGTGTVRYSW